MIGYCKNLKHSVGIALETAIQKSADLLEKGEYGPVEDLVKKAVQIGLQKDLVLTIGQIPKVFLKRLKTRTDK